MRCLVCLPPGKDGLDMDSVRAHRFQRLGLELRSQSLLGSLCHIVHIAVQSHQIAHRPPARSRHSLPQQTAHHRSEGGTQGGWNGHCLGNGDWMGQWSAGGNCCEGRCTCHGGGWRRSTVILVVTSIISHLVGGAVEISVVELGIGLT